MKISTTSVGAVHPKQGKIQGLKTNC